MPVAFSSDTKYGLRFPASAAALALHPAGRCPNNSSLFPPLAAVAVVASHSIARPIAASRQQGPTPADGPRRNSRPAGRKTGRLYYKVLINCRPGRTARAERLAPTWMSWAAACSTAPEATVAGMASVRSTFCAARWASVVFTATTLSTT